MMGSLCLAMAIVASLESGSGESGSWPWQPSGQGGSPARAAAEVRMTPEVLAAAGFTAAHAADMADLLAESPLLLGTLASTRESLAEARDAVRTLAWQVRLDPSNQTLRTTLAGARATEAAARAARQAAQEQAVEALCEVGPSGAEEAVAVALDQCRFDNPAFLVAPRTPAESRRLRLAEIHARRQARLGEPPASAAAQALDAARAAPGYAAAARGVAENLAGIKAALAVGP